MRLESLAGALLALPALGALGLVITFGVDVPIGDEWNTPGNQLTWALERPLTLSDFTNQHNESRPAIAAVIGSILAWRIGWHPKLSMLLSWLCVVLTGFVLHRLLTASDGVRGPFAFAAAFGIQALLFSPAQLENQLWGIQLIMFVPGLCLATCLWLGRSSRPPPLVFTGCALLALLATYSFSSGMIVWLLGCPAPWIWIRARVRGNAFERGSALAPWTAAYALCGALAITSFFWGYAATPGASSLTDTLQAPVLFASFLLAWLGLLFGAHSDHVAGSQIVGLVAISTVFATVWLLAVRVRRPGGWRLASEAYPWLISILYAIAIGVATSGARAQMGAEAALASRYASIAIWAPIGLVGSWTALALDARRSTSVGRIALGGLALLLATLTAWSWAEGLRVAPSHRAAGRQAVMSLRFVDEIPGNPLLALIYPRPSLVQERAPRLRAAGILPIPSVGSWFGEALDRPPARLAEGEWSEQRLFRELRIFGRAWIPGTGRPAAAALVALARPDGALRPITVLAQRDHRSGPLFLGLLPIGTGAPTSGLVVYAVDLEGRSIYRLQRQTPSTN